MSDEGADDPVRRPGAGAPQLGSSAVAPAQVEAPHEEQLAAVDFSAILTTFAATLGAVQRRLSEPDVQLWIEEFSRKAMAVADAIDAFDSPGFSPHFTDLGRGAFESQTYALLVRHLAYSLHEEQLEDRAARKALHSLARRKNWSRSAKHDATVIEQAREAIIAGWFTAAGRNDLLSEFLRLAKCIRAGESADFRRLYVIAAEVAPAVRPLKGRPPRFETALHGVFLYLSSGLGGQSGCTFSEQAGDYIDSSTAATRTELGDADYDPTAGRKLAAEIRVKVGETVRLRAK